MPVTPSSNGVNTQSSGPLPEPTPPDKPGTSVQSQLGLLITALLTVATFIWHVDLGNLAAPLSVLAFAVYGAAVAIAHAWKQHSYHQAMSAYNSQRLEVAATRHAARDLLSRDEAQQAFSAVRDHMTEVEGRLDAVEGTKRPRKVAQKAPQKRAQRATSGRTAARKTSRPRKAATAR